MNAAISAKKILKKLKRYTACENVAGTRKLAAETGHLGKLLGTYTNEGYGFPEVEVFEFGVHWGDQEGNFEVLFTEIDEVGFTNGKESLSLALILKSGVRRELPVAGNDGKFYDCFAMHRFLRNVASDAVRFPEEWKR
jgi:hypothetical protein